MSFKWRLPHTSKLQHFSDQCKTQQVGNLFVRRQIVLFLLIAALIFVFSHGNNTSIVAELQHSRISDIVLEPQFQYFLSSCVIVRASSDLMGEFLVRNHIAGVDHFFIYGDDDEPSEVARLRAIFKALEGLVTYIPNGRAAPTDEENPDNYVQMRLYRNCLQTFGHLSKWVTLIDTDEFFETNSLPFSDQTESRYSRRAFLHDILTAHDVFPVLCVRWKTALTNGQLHSPKQGEVLSDLFPRTCKVQVNNKEKLALRKMILQPRFVDMKQSPKLDVAIHKGFSFTGQMKNLHCKWGLVHDMEPPVYLIHYWSRDLSSFLRKIRRGRPRKNIASRNLGDLFRRESTCIPETNTVSPGIGEEVLRRAIRKLPFFPPPQEGIASLELAVGSDSRNSTFPFCQKRVFRLISALSEGKDFSNTAYCENRESEACSKFDKDDSLQWPFPWAEYLSSFNVVQNESNLFI